MNTINLIDRVRTINVINYIELDKDTAKVLFTNRLRNRDIRMLGKTQYKTDMNTGKWRTYDRSQTPLLINKAGCLAGGQHRIAAFIDSDLSTILFPVVLDATDEETENQDANIFRSLRDKVVMFGDGVPAFDKLKAPSVIAIVKPLRAVLIESNRIISGTIKPTPEELQRLASEYKGYIEELDNVVSKSGKLRKRAPVLAAFVLAKKLGMDEAVWTNAVHKVDLGIGLVKDSPLHRLSKVIDSAHGKGGNDKSQSDLLLQSLKCLKEEHKGSGTFGKVTANIKHCEGW